MALYGVDTLRDLDTFTDHGDGFQDRPWKAEYVNVRSLEKAKDLARRVGREGGVARVWHNGDVVYAVCEERLGVG